MGAERHWILRFLSSAARECRLVVDGLIHRDHPILAHVIPIRRCNLACSFCNEYDDHSDPVATEEMCRRIELLADLGTSAVTISGGEPLLHPELERIIEWIRRRGMIAGLFSNGYLLSRGRIRSLNDAGLEHLQISIDNVEPDGTSMKSLKVLDGKLCALAEEALFKVNVNSVLGSGIENPLDVLQIGRRAVGLGFTCTVGVIHDGHGAMRPLDSGEREVYRRLRHLGKKGYPQINQYFQDNLVKGKPNRWWRCRAGARYLYICEDGLVHYCSQQRGYPGIPLARYSAVDIRREYLTDKPCAPYCTISCSQAVSVLDAWRDPQELPAFQSRQCR